MKHSVARGKAEEQLCGDFVFRNVGGSAVLTTTLLLHDTSSVTFNNVPELLFPVVANATYIFEAYIIYRCNDIGFGPGFAFIGPANYIVALHRTAIVNAISTTSPYVMNGTGYDDPVASCPATPIIATDYLAHMNGLIRLGKTAGKVQIRYKSGDASAKIEARIGSTLTYRKVF